MGFLTDLFGGPGKVTERGGGFDKAIKPYAEEGLKDLQSAYREGPMIYRGPRVAGFDPAQKQAQASLMALSIAQPDYFQTATAGLGEAIDLQRQAGAAITPEMLAQQRQMLAPTIDAERQAADYAFREAVRDIGVGAGGAGVGALTGARADIMRGGAAGERAMAEAQLQGRLTDQALGTLESQFGRQAGAAAGLGSLTGQALGISKEGTQDELTRANLAMGVGEQRQQLTQQQIGANREMFQENDPFAQAQRYLQTIYAAPTQETTRTQDPSTFQEIMGVTAAFAAEGGQINRAGGGGISNLFFGGQPGKDPYSNIPDAKDSPFTSEEEAENKEIEESVDEGFGGKSAHKKPSKETGESKDADGLAASMGSKTIGKTGTVNSSQRQAALSELARMVSRNNGGGIFRPYESKSPNKAPAGTFGFFEKLPQPQQPTPFSPEAQAAIDAEEKRKLAEIERAQAAINASQNRKTAAAPARQAPMATGGLRSISPVRVNEERNGNDNDKGNEPEGIMGRILGGLKSAHNYYRENLDPLKGMTRRERLQVGLGILAANPELGESPLTTTARGALGAIQDVEEAGASVTTARMSPVPMSVFREIDEGILGLQKTGTKEDADKRNRLAFAAQTQAGNELRAGLIPNDNVAFQTKVAEIYTASIRDAYNVTPVDSASNAGTGDVGKGSASSGIAGFTPKN